MISYDFDPFVSNVVELIASTPLNSQSNPFNVFFIAHVAALGHNANENAQSFAGEAPPGRSLDRFLFPGCGVRANVSTAHPWKN